MFDKYTVETDPPILPLRLGSTGPGVRRVQEWLGLHGHGVAIDGEYGPATERAVGDFRRDGCDVDRPTWDKLTAPLRTASDRLQLPSFGGAVVAIAQKHLERQAREVGGDNRGPWVRHYCRGHSVAWCQGFASTIWADASRNTGIMSPLDLVLDGIWCLFVPRMVTEARHQGRFVDGRNPAGATIPAGSMFFLRGGQYGYTHVGLVEAMHADGIMSTIEGNTNDEGSANGYEVARRIRRIAAADFGLAV
jgi:peptidoglycan hydrolase-like protein with peptidoglycan-binding domain